MTHATGDEFHSQSLEIQITKLKRKKQLTNNIFIV
jgi:hypothetical protein